MKDYIHKRNLILTLVGSAIEVFLTWHNPLEQLELRVPGEDTITAWRNQVISEKQWRDITRLAWDISPTLAVFLPSRYAACPGVSDSVTLSLWLLRFSNSKSLPFQIL